MTAKSTKAAPKQAPQELKPVDPPTAAEAPTEGNTPPAVEQEQGDGHDPSALVGSAGQQSPSDFDVAISAGPTESEALTAAVETIQAMAGISSANLLIIRSLQVARDLPLLPEGQVATPVNFPPDQISAFKDEDGETMLVVASGGALFKAKAGEQET